MKPLTRHTAKLPDAPPPRVLQFGGGNFLRGFLDWMLHELNANAGFGGSAILVKPTPSGDYDALKEQDGLFHLCLRGLQDGRPVEQDQLVTSIGPIIHPYREFNRFLETARQPGLRFVVSNTTEAGLVYRAADRKDDRPAPSFPGKLTQWLYHRYQKLGDGAESGCYILPFELIEGNGAKLREIVLRHAGAWGLEQGFLDWIHAHHTFCDTLVDRIVPGYPTGEAEAIQTHLGYRDQCLVQAEPYHLLVLENYGDLPSVFPAREAGLNVLFTDDLGRYRDLKVRILNGAHTAMVPIGLLAGLPTVGAVMADDKVSGFLEAMLREEVAPLLPVPPEEAEAYIATTLDRFRNPFIRHELKDIALNSSAKVASRYLPSMIEYFRRHRRVPRRLAAALAAMIRFYRGTWRGQPLPLRDSPEAVDHFAGAWKAPTLEETARQALRFWPSIPAAMRGPLADRLVPALKAIEAKGLPDMLP